ncbi:MAG: hypothetical protein ACI4VH_00835 [Clostridia bacterium]
MSENSKKENKFNSLTEEGWEDTTKYGEFISSYFAWVSLPQQKSKVDKLENMTKKKEKNK